MSQNSVRPSKPTPEKSGLRATKDRVTEESRVEGKNRRAHWMFGLPWEWPMAATGPPAREDRWCRLYATYEELIWASSMERLATRSIVLAKCK